MGDSLDVTSSGVPASGQLSGQLSGATSGSGEWGTVGYIYLGGWGTVWM